MAQLIKHPTLAQVMNSQFVSSSPTLGSVLTAQSLGLLQIPSLSDPPLLMLSLSPSLSLLLPCSVSLSLSLSLSPSLSLLLPHSHTHSCTLALSQDK